MLEGGQVERDELRQVGLIEQALDLVHLIGTDSEAGHEPVAHRARGGARDLEPHDVAEAPLPQLRLDRLEQIVGVVGDLEVRVSRDAEERALRDLHPREEHGEVVGDHSFEGYEPLAGRDEAPEALRHLHAREALLVRVGIDRDHAE